MFLPGLQALAGGSSGLGAETIRALAHAGADCVLCCRNDMAGQAVAAELQPTVKVRPGSVQAHRHATAAAHSCCCHPVNLLLGGTSPIPLPLLCILLHRARSVWCGWTWRTWHLFRLLGATWRTHCPAWTCWC